jgi:5-hydroxyisourate hydrolase
MLDAGNYRIVKTFNTAANGRSDGALFEGEMFKPGRYELTMYVGDYYTALGTKLPSPAFISRVPLRFGIADARERYHIAVLFGPWSYAYYRGS